MITLYHQIMHVLAEDPLSRDDDSRLTVVLWKNFYPTRIVNPILGEGKPVDYVSLQDIVLNLPKIESIGRSRRIIQNTLGLYPPTRAEIARARKMKMEAYNEAYMHNFTPTQAKLILDTFLGAKGKDKKGLKELLDNLKKNI